MPHNDDTRYHIAIIGGGVAGLGAALEASRWGFETVLLEKGTLCQATSANSLRIIHGGFRYLQTLNLHRVRKSLKAKQELLEKYPQIVRPLACVMPLKKRGLKSRAPVRAASLLYNLLHYWETGTAAANRSLTSSEVDRKVRLLSGRAPHGALLWYDAHLIDPQRLCHLLRQEAVQHGAEILEGANVTNITRKRGGFELSYSIEAASKTVAADVVINAAGPWIDQVSRLTDWDNLRPSRRWCLAFNIIVPRILEEEYAVACEAAGQDGKNRLFFVTRRGRETSIGTGYLPFDGDPALAAISEQEIQDFVAAFNSAFKEQLAIEDVAGIEIGVLPLAEKTGASLQLVGDEQIFDNQGFIEILSTKYTTFMPQAREVLLKASKYLKSRA